MNRIINININGILFHVDELAYDRLKNYLESLKAHFRHTEGKDEILADIEARIAEMLNEELKGRKEVVMMPEVDKVIAAMGHPEDFSDAETESREQAQSAYSGPRDYSDRPKRLYRNTEERVLGGVCSGIAYYFNIDTIWVRLAFLIAFFGFGSGFLIYIILWIVMPPARTSAEKLEMRGYDVNISNLEKSFKGEMGDVKKKWTELRDEARQSGSRANRDQIGSFIGQLLDGIGRVLRAILPILAKVFAVIFIFIGVTALVSIIVSLFAVSGMGSFRVPFIVQDVVGRTDYVRLGGLGTLLVGGIPFLALTYYGIRMLLSRGAGSKWVGISFFTLWICGVALTAIVGTHSARRFSDEFTIIESEELTMPKHDTLYLQVNENGVNRVTIRSGRHIKIREAIQIEDEDYDLSRVQLDIRRSADKGLHFIKEKESHGSTKAEAKSLAEAIDYRFSLEDSVLVLDEVFKLHEGSSWRAQDLDLVLEIPDGMVVVMTKGMEKIIYDIDNVQDMYDYDMIGKRWLMTQKGLNCQDCTEEELRENEEHYHYNYKHHLSVIMI